MVDYGGDSEEDDENVDAAVHVCRGVHRVTDLEIFPVRVSKDEAPPPPPPPPQELHPWRLELEIFPSRLPCGHPYRPEMMALVAIIMK